MINLDPSVTSASTAAASPQDELLVSVDNLSVRFGTLRAVNGVSFQVRSGEILGIVGESGSGKSIAARSLVNLLPPTATATGSVKFRGLDVLRASKSELRRLRGRSIGFVFQDAVAALDPVYTISSQLIEAYRASVPGTSFDAARQRARDLLVEVGISDPDRCLASYPHQLSGGMRQRVVIAAALISDPQLVIADEPTTALDVGAAPGARPLPERRPQPRGIGDPHHPRSRRGRRSLRPGRRVLGGTIAEEADTEDLFETPRHPYTSALLDSLPKRGVPKPFKALPGMPPKIIEEAAACPFQPRCARALPACAEQLPPETLSSARRYRCFNPLP